MLRRRKEVILLVLSFGLLAGGAHIMAQGKKKKPGGPETQVYKTDSLPAPVAGKEEMLPNRYFSFPQFYSYLPSTVNDTVYKYECYDANQNPINVDTVQNANGIKFISFIKTFTDYTNTYVDSQGKAQPVPVSKMLYKYDRTGADSWESFDFVNNYKAELKEYKDEVLKADTTVLVDPITGTRQLTIRRYYRVVELPRQDSSKADSMVAGTIDTTKKVTDVINYLVPEFYFHLPRKIKDTTLEFLCYDQRDSLMPNVDNYDSVRYYSLMKTYTDSEHTYVDSNGLRQLLPVQMIVKRFDRISKSKWMCVEYPGNKYTEFTEYKSVIVGADTERVADAASGGDILKIYSRYKLLK